MKMICPSCKVQETAERRFTYSFPEHDTQIYLCNSCAKDGGFEEERQKYYLQAVREGRVRH